MAERKGSHGIKSLLKPSAIHTSSLPLEPTQHSTAASPCRHSQRFRSKVLNYWDFERISTITTQEGICKTVVVRDVPGEETILLDSSSQDSLTMLQSQRLSKARSNYHRSFKVLKQSKSLFAHSLMSQEPSKRPKQKLSKDVAVSSIPPNLKNTAKENESKIISSVTKQSKPVDTNKEKHVSKKHHEIQHSIVEAQDTEDDSDMSVEFSSSLKLHTLHKLKKHRKALLESSDDSKSLKQKLSFKSRKTAKVFLDSTEDSEGHSQNSKNAVNIASKSIDNSDQVKSSLKLKRIRKIASRSKLNYSRDHYDVLDKESPSKLSDYSDYSDYIHPNSSSVKRKKLGTKGVSRSKASTVSKIHNLDEESSDFKSMKQSKSVLLSSASDDSVCDKDSYTSIPVKNNTGRSSTEISDTDVINSESDVLENCSDKLKTLNSTNLKKPAEMSEVEAHNISQGEEQGLDGPRNTATVIQSNSADEHTSIIIQSKNSAVTNTKMTSSKMLLINNTKVTSPKDKVTSKSLEANKCRVKPCNINGTRITTNLSPPKRLVENNTIDSPSRPLNPSKSPLASPHHEDGDKLGDILSDPACRLSTSSPSTNKGFLYMEINTESNKKNVGIKSEPETESSVADSHSDTAQVYAVNEAVFESSITTSTDGGYLTDGDSGMVLQPLNKLVFHRLPTTGVPFNQAAHYHYHIAKGLSVDGADTFFINIARGSVTYKVPVKTVFITLRGEGSMKQKVKDGGDEWSLQTRLQRHTELLAQKGTTVVISKDEQSSETLLLCLLLLK